MSGLQVTVFIKRLMALLSFISLLRVSYRPAVLCHSEGRTYIEGVQELSDKENSCSNKKFWEELIAYFPFLLQEPHRKRRVQKFFYCYMGIRCRCNVFTEPLPNNDMGIRI
jgi:hypothetical protein